MKVVVVLFGLLGLFLFTFLGVRSCNNYYYGKNGVYAEQKQQCVSPRTLQGCETTALQIEEQLRNCEHSFLRCIEINAELQEKLKRRE